MPTPRSKVKTASDQVVVQFPTFVNQDVIAQYIAHRATTGRRWRPETIRVRTYQLHLVAEQLAPTTLHAATEDDILRWHAALPGRPETIASYTSAVHGLYRWMCTTARPRLRPDDPTLILERPAIPHVESRPMVDRHFDLALACAVSDAEMYLWLGLMGCCGLRCCEVAWMHVGDVEQREDGSGMLHIEGKGGKRRTVPAGAMLMLTMKPFLHGRGPVFTRPSDGKAYSPASVSGKVSTFLQGVGVPSPFRAHSLRHRFGADYHAIDVDLYQQAKLMGHASVDTTARYTAISPAEAAKHIEQLTYWRLQPGRRTGPLRRAAG